jgi:hypothetical protein
MTLAQTVLIFAMALSTIIATYYILLMVENDKVKAKEYDSMKAVRDAEHVKFMNEYYAERDAERAEWIKAIESWSIVETSV